MKKPIIEFQNVYKSFGSQTVLADMSLQIQEGELFTLLGGSGTGKTVLLKHVLGLIKPDRGKISVLSHAVSEMTEKELLPFRTKVGMVFQNAALFNSLTVYDNIAFPLRELHLYKTEEEVQQVVMKNARLLGLEKYMEKMPSELSGGMLKRVALTRSMCLNSRIVLYDEPTSGLDPILAHQVDEIIYTTNKKFSKTTVVVTHDLESALNLADRIGVLYKGKLIFCGSPDKLKASEHPYIQKFLQNRQCSAYIDND